MAPTAKAPPVSIVTKLCRIAAEIDNVERKGWNAHHQYRYVREVELTTAIRGLFSEQNLWIIPNVIGLERNGPLCTLKIDYQLVDGESGETLHIPWFCEGSDAGDKGIAKALTGGNKTLLSKLLQIPLVDGEGEYADSENTRHSPPVERAPADRPADDPTKPRSETDEGLYQITACTPGSNSKGELLKLVLHDGTEAEVAPWDMENAKLGTPQLGLAVTTAHAEKQRVRLVLERRGKYVNVKHCEPMLVADDVPF